MTDHYGEIEREILRLEEELRQAEMRLDMATLNCTFADDIMVTAPIGIVVDKPAVMAEVHDAASNAKVETFDKDDFKVRAFGDTAVASYRLTAKARYQGQAINRQLRLTDVWMKRQGHWQVVARHTANIAQQ